MLVLLVVVMGMVVMLMLVLVLMVTRLIGALQVFGVHFPAVRQNVSKGTLDTELAVTLLKVFARLGV